MFIVSDYTLPPGATPGRLSDESAQELVQNIMLLAVGPEHSRRLRADIPPEPASPG